MKRLTDSELIQVGFTALAKALGLVEAERFIVLNNREPRNYTTWRKTHMYVGESVEETAAQARLDAEAFRRMRRSVTTAIPA